MSKTERALEAADGGRLDEDDALDGDELDGEDDGEDDVAPSGSLTLGDGDAPVVDDVDDLDDLGGPAGNGSSARRDGDPEPSSGGPQDEDSPPDSTAELMAQVDRALEHYAASVEEYITTEPMAVVDASERGNGNGSWPQPLLARRTDLPAPATEEDEGFFVIPETISPTGQMPVIDPEVDPEVASEVGPDGDPDAPVARRSDGDEPDPPVVGRVPDRDAVVVDDDVTGVDDDGADAFVDRTGSARTVDDDLLEELRRADIDGPTVEMLPQDDTTSLHRRPRRSPEYDPAPVPIPAKPPRLLGRRPRVRKVTRVVRHVDPWSVFKIALIANLVLYVVLLTAGVLLWNVANATGTVDNVERFFESFGWTSFEFDGGEIYHSAWIAGLFGVIGLTGIAVLLATLFNLITDLVGGVRFTVLEEEVVERRTSPMRRFVVRRAEPEVPAVIQDSTGPMIRETVVDDSGAIERRAG